MAVDARASSLVEAVDAAIERVVAHFEENDLALRADVLRALAAQAKLAFETERVRQRLRQHPLTRDLIDAVSTRSSVFARLDAGLSVQAYSCEYDAQRNVEILATVQWILRAEDKQQQQKKKKRKTQQSGSRADRSVPLTLRYAYSRTLTDEGATLVEFRVTSCVGTATKPSELVHFVMTSSAPYPRSYYEDTNAGLGGDDSDDGSDDEDAAEEEAEAGKAENTRKGRQAPKGSKEAHVDEEDSEDDEGEDDNDEKDANGDGVGSDGDAAGGHGHCSDDDCKDDHCADEGCGCEHGDEEDAPFGEAVEAFNVGESAVEEILTWMGEDGVDPADAVGFFLALPVTEDEWQLDERITEIAFGVGGSEDGDAASSDASDVED